MTTTEDPKFPPIVCTPWCDRGDGHLNAVLQDDQTCWGASGYVALDLESAGVDVDGGPYPARLGAMVHRGFSESAVVYFHAISRRGTSMSVCT
jgi:hypothetical protein